MVSVDNVYQKVLALANKEQRGYITPQEFNLLADQAQMDIFEKYFYDLEQFQRRTDGTEELIEDKIAIFKEGPNAIGGDTYDLSNLTDAITGKDNLHKIIQITRSSGDNVRVAEKIEHEDYSLLQVSPLTRATDTRPVFFIKQNTVYVYPETGSNTIKYIRKPIPPNWTYYISPHNDAVYNSSAIDHQDFELHASEENSLVIKILQLAGVTIKDFNLVQAATQKEISTNQQKKQ